MYTFDIMSANPQYADGEVIANKYVVEGLIGESPASRTFLANGNDGKLCLKLYRQELSTRLMSAPDFFLKAGIMTEIEHDNLCACVDVQEEMGYVFVARAYAEGQNFEDWARTHRGDANYFSRGLELLWQICQGLTAMHERTRHLNIHPGNVFVGPLVAKLGDWDPRALSNAEMTPDPIPVRSEYLGYRAPEVSGRSGFLSYPSTDLYAVAGLLYRLTKGEHPASNPSQTLSEVRNLDRELSAFLSKALHPRPEDRFQDAGSFSDALWELQTAMQRMQERSPRSAPEPPRAASAPSAPAKSAGNDTFFNFFPPADETSVNIKTGAGTAAAPDRTQTTESKPSGDTLFGAPSFLAPTQEPSRPAGTLQPELDLPLASASYQAPRPESKPAPAHRSGLSDLETPGTLFGSEAPLFATPAKPAPRKQPDAPVKPLPISLSSLEKDPLEMAGSGDVGGFTAYGFKGAGDNRTGIYTPEAKVAETKTKLMILLGTVGILVLLLGLGGLFLYLRSHAAHKDAIAESVEPPVLGEPGPSQTKGSPERPTRKRVANSTPRSAQNSEASTVTPEEISDPEATTETPQPNAEPKIVDRGYSEPPMPIEPPRPGSAPDKTPSPPLAEAVKTAAAPINKAKSHVSPEREAALMAMVQSRVWPNKSAERLRAANELNDLGKTAEANVAYSKVLAAGDVNEKQKILAFGGLAVTFQSMGMLDEAKDAVQKILEINPRNGFALKLKDKLK